MTNRSILPTRLAAVAGLSLIAALVFTVSIELPRGGIPDGVLPVAGVMVLIGLAVVAAIWFARRFSFTIQCRD